MVRKASIIIIFITFYNGIIQNVCGLEKDTLYTKLTDAFNKKELYVKQKWERIEVLKHIVERTIKEQDLYYRYSVYYQIFSEYKSFKYDSSFTYALNMLDIAYELSNAETLADAKINIAFVLLSSGFFQQSIDTLESININNLPETLKIKYYKTLSRAWIDFADYVQDTYYRPIYNNFGNTALENAIQLCDSVEPDYYYLKGLYELRNDNKPKAKYYYEKLATFHSLSIHDKAILASTLSYIYSELGFNAKSEQELIKAAIYDIEAATKETVALINLAEKLFNDEAYDLSLLCINQALEDANFYGARHRILQISSVLPLIESTLLKTKEKQRNIYMVFSIILIIAVIALLFVSYVAIGQNRKLKEAKRKLSAIINELKNSNTQLSEANIIKEEYIGHFFNVISNYIGKIEKLKKSALRNLVLKKVNEVEQIISNIDLSSEREELYASFDSIFIKLFPKFVERYNANVAAEDKVAISQDMSFTPELRIYALKRLGINDNEKIARFLGYSVTTVYTYRTKLKKRSPNPNVNLEDVIMNIKMS